MFDLIILLIVIKIIISVANRNKTGKKKDASARPNEPRKHGFGGFSFGNAREWASKRMPEAEGLTRHTASRKEPAPEPEILKRVNQQIKGTDASTADLETYRRLLERQQCTDIREIARQMNCTMYQVIHEIRDFQELGYFQGAVIDDSNYVIHYPGKERPTPRATAGKGERNATREAIRQAASEPPICAVTEKPESASRHSHGEPGEERRLDPSQIGNGYMTMTPDYRITYMTMPEQGMPISYNTIPEYPENEA